MRIMSDKAVTREDVQVMVDEASKRYLRAFKFAAAGLAVSVVSLGLAVVALFK